MGQPAHLEKLSQTIQNPAPRLPGSATIATGFYSCRNAPPHIVGYSNPDAFKDSSRLGTSHKAMYEI